MQNTSRLGLWLPEDGDPVAALREAIAANAAALDDVALYDQGAASSRPVSTPESPGIAGRIYRVPNTGAIWLDTGTGWAAIPGAAGCFSAHRAGSGQSLPSGTTVLVFNTEDWDASDWYDTATGRFTPQAAGYYRLSAQVALDSAVSCNLRLLKNGSEVRRVVSVGQVTAIDMSQLVAANGSGDRFEFALNHAASPVTTLMISTVMQGEMVGLI